MTAKQLVTGTVVGAAAMTASGYALFGLILGDFFSSALRSDSMTTVSRDSPLVWAVALGALSYGALLTLAIMQRFKVPSIGDGAKVGGVLGLLVWLTADLMLYGISNVLTLTAALVAPVIELVPSAVSGAAIAWTLRTTT